MATYDDIDQFLSGIEFDDASALPPSLIPTLVPARIDSPAPWNARLPFDVALGDTEDAICDRYNITPHELEHFFLIPAFRREVADHQRHIREEGVTFRQKAKVQAEMYLEVLDTIVNDPEISPATRLDAIKSVVKWGDLEPKVDKAAQSGLPQFNIQINL